MISPRRWGEKPYHSLDFECKKRFGEKIYKISLETNMTCPNRDGTLDTRGCIFCSGSGSGDFAAPICDSITEQINLGIKGLSSRKSVGSKFIAYFQSFTNTYAPVSVLRPMFMEAISHEQIVGLSIATRPDCLPDDVLSLLHECNKRKPTTVELGLQTIHEQTAAFIRRGYELPVFEKAVVDLKARDIEVVVHVIAGLPGESFEDFMATIDYLAALPIDGIKIQLLHILKGTDLANYLGSEVLHVLTEDEYLHWVTTALTHLPSRIVIHRLTGDGPKALLLAPLWSSKKRMVLNHLHQKMKEEDLWQGKYFLSNNKGIDV